MNCKRTALAALAVAFLSSPAAAACLDDAKAMSASLEEMRKAPDATEVPAAIPVGGEALTGDPLNPKPAGPSTADVSTAAPTSEEAEAVMPGADASVELVGEDMAQITALHEEAMKAAEAGDEQGCTDALARARAMMPQQ